MISIPGGILSALIDEANSCPNDSVQQGLLFGNKTFKRTEVLSDTQEDKVVDEYQIGTDNYSEKINSVYQIAVGLTPFISLSQLPQESQAT